MEKITTGILSAVIIGFLTLNLLLLKKVKEVNLYNERINQSFISATIENEDYKRIIGFFYEKQGMSIQNPLCVTDTGDKKEIMELLEEKPTLVFNYSSYDCSDCVNRAFEKIKESGYNDRILITSDFKNISSMNYLKKKYLFPNAMFLKIEELDLTDTPAVFFLNKEMKISKFLIINKDDNILEKYLNSIIKQ